MEFDDREIKRQAVLGNDRGVALLIVLLVTALLIALVFEFSYATRISLNNAINYRNSERAYYLARSGVYAFVKYGDLRTQVPQDVVIPLPFFSEGDTTVSGKWQDEAGKIKINDVKTDPVTKIMAQRLFESKSIDAKVLDSMLDQSSDVNNTMTLLSGLHKYMSNEDFNKVSGFLTVATVPSHTININTASQEVLESLGISQGGAEQIVQERQKNPYTDLASVPGLAGIQINGVNVRTYVTVNPGTIYTIYAYANVGGYTKEIDVIVNGSVISYWREL